MTKAELDHLLDQARASSRRSRRPFPKPGTRQYEQIRDQLVQFLVRRAQLAAEADARGLEISDEDVEQRRGALVEQAFGGNEKLYEQRLEENGSTDEQMSADLEAALIEEALLEDVGKGVEVSDAEMRRHYRQNAEAYAPPYERVKTAIRERLLQAKRSEARAQYVEGIVREHSVDYQAGFAPRV